MKAELRVSLSSNDTPNLQSLTLLLCELKIAGTVFLTMSSVCEKDVFVVEPGFVMYVYNIEKSHICSHIWPKLQEMFPSAMTCAHVSDTEGSSCCILDYLRPSVCPSTFFGRVQNDDEDSKV
jgi:S-adenosylmethionine/arginine decarboxylase-like enzyme